MIAMRKSKKYSWEMEREPGFTRSKHECNDIVQLSPDKCFDEKQFVFTRNNGIVGLVTW